MFFGDHLGKNYSGHVVLFKNMFALGNGQFLLYACIDNTPCDSLEVSELELV